MSFSTPGCVFNTEREGYRLNIISQSREELDIKIKPLE